MSGEFLQFSGPIIGGEGTRVGWIGSWPPPERMWVLVGKMVDFVSYLDPDDEQPPGVIEECDRRGLLHRYKRISYSELPDLSHVARGAVYVPEEAS